MKTFSTETLPTLKDLLTEDLEYVATKLQSEMETLAGHKLLITGGAGFLGYYLTQSVLHWNRTRPTAPITLTVFDNYFRGVPAWLEALRRDPNLNLRRHDMMQPLPQDMDDFDYIIHAAGIASPLYYRRFPIECMDTNITGLRKSARLLR